MAILVTGGSGFVGVHTSVELLNAGYDIVMFDNFSNSKPEALKRVYEITNKNFRFYEMDMRDKEKLEVVFSENTIDAVIHLAGLKAVGESVHMPLKYYDNNIHGTITLIEMMKKYNVKKLVFSSSATVYGLQSIVPISENFSLEATNPYGRSKLMIEEILRDLYISDDEWGIIPLRYFNPIGAHESGLIGESPNGVPNNLMPYITQVASGKLKEMLVFGNNYPTPDGTGVRDYIHVTDLALGHVKAIERLMAGVTGVNAYNLGTGRGYSVLELIETFEEVSGRKIPYTIVDRRPGDVAICYADPTKAKDELGWAAQRGIEEMCIDAWRWQINNPNGYESVLELERSWV
ncbi:UDP-glucose 4-epimerase GalE [Paenibacillus aestuarii]|uniref:UDP-glucose 4-epimerase n=1 Tax=Paenibacillus aestuarii TaxID=516965 RepID=A0ABW0K106_9BACL|nr:UDP-glucose 4-epimerase GalE [Paenibacillus aestuarii]